MPRKSATTDVLPEEGGSAVITESSVNITATSVCGHVNRQSIGVDGRPDNCSCFLEKGHSAPHRGKHMMRKHTHKIEEKRIVGENNEDIEVEAEWLDGASVPFSETPPVKEIPPKSLAEQEFGINTASVMKGL